MGRTCELCPKDSETPASFYCAADVCYLCKACDQEVHSANRLARRHIRRPISQDELEDGSSINDDSDARVPDVSTTTASFKTAATLVTDASTNDSLDLDKKHDVLASSTTTAATTAATAAAADLPSLNDVSVTFEDAAEYDFCFEALGARMPLLAAGDDDAIFTDGKVHKTLYAEMSWDSVVSDAFEHVVPDVETHTRKDADGKPVASWDATRGRVTSHSAPHVRHVKGENIHAPLDLDLDLEYEITNLVDDAPTRQVSNAATSDVSPLKKEPVTNATDMNVVKEEAVLKPHVQVKDVKMEDVQHVATTEDASKGKDTTAQENSDDVASNNDKKGKTPPKTPKATADEDEAKLQEQRKKRRMEALARFRSKRANRSFTKKVRYECRKQLADSRPRVKGRFVRKVEMALFRKYGALYRDHLDELDSKANAPCVPSV